MKRLLALVIILLVISAPVAWTSAQTSGNASIEGVVIDSSTGKPIISARVSVEGTRNAVFSGPDGRFTLTNVIAGRRRVTAEKDGYSAGTGGFTRGRRVKIDPGQNLRNLVLTIVPAGVISGRVLDERGEALSGASVQIYRPAYVNGHARLLPVFQETNPRTNDRGDFRAFWLDPGDYFVSAMPPPPGADGNEPSSDPSIVPIFYPGTTDPGAAQQVSIHSGEEYRMGDLVLSAAHSFSIRCVVEDPEKTRPAIIESVIRGREDLSIFEHFVIRADANKNRNGFEIRVPSSGAYEIAVGWKTSDGDFLGRADVTVNGQDIDNVTLSATRGGVLTGRVTAGATSIREADVQLTSDDGITPALRARTDAEGRFTINGVHSSHYRVRIAGHDDAYISRIDLNGSASSSPWIDPPPGMTTGTLAITLSAGSVIEGVVLDGGRPFVNAVVALVPADPNRLDLYRTSESDQFGTFEMHSIAPGAYTVFAWDDLPAGAEENPEYMEKFMKSGTGIRVNGAPLHGVQVPLIRSGDRS